MAIPKWVTDLVTKVCEDYGVAEPTITWRRSTRHFYSSGRAPKDRVVVTAGKFRRDQKLVLLHELAHYLSPRGDGHSLVFWEKAFELFRRYGVPMRYAQKREYSYRKTAKAGYKNSRPKTTI